MWHCSSPVCQQIFFRRATVLQLTWTSIGDIFLLEASTVLSLDTYQRRGEKLLTPKYISKDLQQSDLRPCDMKMNRGYLLPRGIHCTKCGNVTFKSRGQRILSVKHWYKDQQSYLDFWPCEPKISRGHLFFRGIYMYYSARFKQRGQKILSGHRLVSRPTERTNDRCKTVFQRVGGIKMKSIMMMLYLRKTKTLASFYLPL